MGCFPFAVAFDRIGFRTFSDYNPQIPITYVNPATNQIVQVTVECDTGAFISVAPQSLAQILGLKPSPDSPTVSLIGVGGSTIPATVYFLTLKLDRDTYQGVLVAIAATDDVPFLLGRINFWDLASLNFDNVNRQVCIIQLSPGVAPPAPTSPPSSGGAITYGGGTDYLWALGAYAVAGLLIYGFRKELEY
jgi:hypothetical protein